MKTRYLVSILYILLGCVACFGQASSSLENAKLEAQFFAVYPELATHKQLVNDASAALVSEGYSGKNPIEVFRTLATRSRTLLQSSADEPPTIPPETFTARETAAREEAKRLFPHFSQPNSVLFKRIVEERAELARIYPRYFKNPEWPLMLTRSCAAAIALEAQVAAAEAQKSQVSLEQLQAAVALLNAANGGLSRSERNRMLLTLRDERFITSINRAQDSMTDAEIQELYAKALEQRRLREIANAIRQLQR